MVIYLPESVAAIRIRLNFQRKTFMSTDQQSPIILQANQEHTGIRVAVILVLAGAFVGFFLGFNLILDSVDSLIAEFSLSLSCVLALALALGLAAFTERRLKRNWPSGQRLELSKGGLVATKVDGETVSIDWSTRIIALKWYFSIRGYALGGRERRLPKNYYCLALQLQQDEDRFVVHSYFPKSSVTGLVEGKEFLEIKPAEYYKGGAVRRWIGSTDRPKIPTSVLAGREGLYWIAERRRWTEGLELDASDFQTFLNMVEENLGVWD